MSSRSTSSQETPELLTAILWTWWEFVCGFSVSTHLKRDKYAGALVGTGHAEQMPRKLLFPSSPGGRSGAKSRTGTVIDGSSGAAGQGQRT